MASHTPNQSGFPIIEIPLADPDQVDEVGNLLFDRGIYVTMAVYPLVPRDEVGFRLQLTSAQHRRAGRTSVRSCSAKSPKAFKLRRAPVDDRP